MGVSRKSSTLIRFSIIHHPCWGTCCRNPNLWRSPYVSIRWVLCVSHCHFFHQEQVRSRYPVCSTINSQEGSIWSRRLFRTYAIYCNSFVCSTICPMTKRDNDFSGNFCQRPKVGNLVSQRWFLWAMECQTPPKRFIAGKRDWKALNEGKSLSNCLFRIATWANLSLLVSMVSMVFSVGMRRLRSECCIPSGFCRSFGLFMSFHPMAWPTKCGFRSPLHLSRGSWFDLPRTESATCGSWVLSLKMFEVQHFSNAPEISEIEGKRGIFFANSQLTGEDNWHFCHVGWCLQNVFDVYIYLYIIYTYYLHLLTVLCSGMLFGS